jgi:hypothetical protein
MQLERVKSELKRRFYDQNKFSGKTINSIIFYLGLGGARISYGGTSPERSKMRWELDEMAMDSRKRIYHGIENDEGCLLVVAGWRRDVTVWPEKLVGEFAGTQAVDVELRREVEGATSGGSR